jgi:uncharacterized protein YjbI with pentapeptide repeats
VINFNGADLSAADLSESSLFHSILDRADLSKSNLVKADLAYARSRGANFNGANIFGASLRKSNLTGATFIDANLVFADFTGADITGADFSRAQVGGTVFGNTDLSKTKGLNTVHHFGPSVIGLDTVYQSGGKIPEPFLRGCGVPDDFIAQIPALVAGRQPIQFYSCFISYSSRDQKFAERLYSDLQSKGVRCWYAPHDLKIGEKIRVGIDESIRVHDKLLLILSKNSIESEWVEKEVETAMERERQQKRTILFPIRLDDTVLKVESGWAADVRRSRNIGDFRRWKSHDTYSKAFERLMRDLQASA